MYYELNYKQKELIERIKKEINIYDLNMKGDFIPVESLWDLVEDIYDGYDYLKEKFEDYKNEVENPDDYYEDKI